MRPFHNPRLTAERMTIPVQCPGETVCSSSSVLSDDRGGLFVSARLGQQQAQHQQRQPGDLTTACLPLEVVAAFALGLLPSSQLVQDVGRVAPQEGSVGRLQTTGRSLGQELLDHLERLFAAQVEVQQRGAVGGDAHEVVEPARLPRQGGRFLEQLEATLRVTQVGHIDALGTDGMATHMQRVLACRLGSHCRRQRLRRDRERSR